jgi:hypothetical protein
MLYQVVLLAAVLVVAGCGGGRAAEPTASSLDESARTVRVSEEISMLGGGGTDYEASWYGLIDSLEVHGESLDVRTSIYPDDEGRDIAKNLCNILNGNLVNAHTAGFGLDTVTVYAQDDPVAYTSAMSGHC